MYTGELHVVPVKTIKTGWEKIHFLVEKETRK